VYDGVPRYRNPNNIFLFRHKLSRSEELGITRQTCLPESELLGEDVESAATAAALSLGREVSGKVAMDFTRLVKTSLRSINLDRQVKREARKKCSSVEHVSLSLSLSLSLSSCVNLSTSSSLPFYAGR